MLRQDTKIKSNTNSQRIGLLALALTLFTGCSTLMECVPTPPKKNFDCTVPVEDKWSCTPLEGTSRSFNCEYT